MDKDRKSELKKSWKAQEREKLEKSIPTTHANLRDLFDHLDREDAPACDHTLRETIQFLQARNLAVEPIVQWLRDNGGYCDCEVMFNVEEKFGEIVGR